jgi:TetR/AcrR family transcriptional regulator, cholesterol catabolism regulator
MESFLHLRFQFYQMDIRKKIIEGAGKLFIENGVRQVTMDSIALSLGISKRTIYENFRDKDDLLINFLNDSIQNHKKQALEILTNSKNVIEALFQFGEYNNRSMKSVNPCFFNDIKKYHPQVFEKAMNNGGNRNHEMTYTLLKRGINEGVFIKEINIEIANLFIHYSLDFFNIIDDKRFSNKEIWISVHLPYLRGICTEKGRDLINQFINKYEKL